MTEILWHVLFVAGFFVLGVPLNIAVVWIYRRKGSSLRQNKFPLLFAAFDLFAGLIVLPLQPPRYLVSDVWVYEIHNGLSTFLMNGYLFTLFMATHDLIHNSIEILRSDVICQKFFKLARSSALVTVLFERLHALVGGDVTAWQHHHSQFRQSQFVVSLKAAHDVTVVGKDLRQFLRV